MRLAVKIISLILALVLLSTSMLSCASSPTVMTIGKFEVSYDLLRYFVKNYMNGYENLTEEDFKNDPELQKQLEANVYSSITELAAYYNLAKKFSLKLTEEDKASIKVKIKQLKESYDSNEEYEEALAESFVTEDVLRTIYGLEILCDKLYDHLTLYSQEIEWNVDIIDADFVESFFSAEYLMIYYSEQDKQEKNTFANSIRSQLVGGTYTMQQIYDKYCTEFSLKIEYQNYDAFTYTEMNEDFEKAVEALEIGEIGEIIDLGNAFQIIHRKPLDMNYYEQHYNTVEGQWLAREFFRYVENYSKELSVVWKTKYENTKFWEMD